MSLARLAKLSTVFAVICALGSLTMYRSISFATSCSLSLYSLSFLLKKSEVIYEDYDDIVRCCCDAWNGWVDMPGNIRTLCSRTWANL